MAQHTEPSQKPFRVIVVGAGIVGLSLSHALQLAKIDHVVLEKHSKIVSLHGAALMIFPGAARILDQFGVLKGIRESVTPIQRQIEHWPDGSVSHEPHGLIDLGSRFEVPVITIDRQSCVTHLYDGLPDKAMIRTSARVERIEHTEDGVKVHLADGSFEEGDMVVGADGVHSLTRQLMWDYAAEHDPSAIPESDKNRNALFTDYKGIYGVSDVENLRGLGPADVHVCLGQDVTKLLFTQRGAVMWSVAYKDEHSSPPKPYKPDAKEQEEVAKRFKDLDITENIKFKDLWESKTRFGMLNIEEGVLDKWHAGRIVLVGDSAHKVTTDIGMGANMSIESATVLANVLHRASTAHPHTPYHPSLPELSALFTQYQSKRYTRAKTFVGISGNVTRMCSYSSLWGRFVVGYIATLPFMQKMQAKRMGMGFARAPKLEYVPTRTINENAEGWKVEKRAKRGAGRAWIVYVLLTSVVGVAVSYAAILSKGRLL